MNKDLIKTRFSKSLSTYNENARIQKKMAERMSELAGKTYHNILELGCGTGLLTRKLNEKIEYKNYDALDIVSDCETYIKEINPYINFINNDIENFINKNDKKYDLIISNAALQWVDDFEKVVKHLKYNLTDNGELIISTFGPEHYREIGLITGTTLNYYSTKELQVIFPDFSIYPEVHIMAFDSPKDVLKHIQLTGVNAIESKSWVKKDLAKFERGYKSLCPNRTTLTYNPIYMKFTKN